MMRFISVLQWNCLLVLLSYVAVVAIDDIDDVAACNAISLAMSISSPFLTYASSDSLRAAAQQPYTSKRMMRTIYLNATFAGDRVRGLLDWSCVMSLLACFCKSLLCILKLPKHVAEHIAEAISNGSLQLFA